MAAGHRDRSWSRLLWLVPTALALSLLSLEGFFLLLQGGTYAPLPPKPVDVEVVELPAPPRVEPPPPPAVAEMPPTQPPPVVETPPPVAQIEPPPAQVEPRSPLPPAPAVIETPPPVAQGEPLPQVKREAKPPTPRAKPLPQPAPAVAPPALASPPPAPTAEAPAVAREQTQPESALSPEETAAIEEHRLRVAEALYSPGGSRNTYEGEKALARSLKPTAPPLTAEQWRALDSMYIVGDKNFLDYIAEHAPLRTAISIHSPPLTKAQWDELDRIYHVGGYIRYDDYLAARTGLKPARPVRLADLTPEERLMIFARRGIRLPPVVSVACKVKLLETQNPAEYERRGTPAVPLDTPAPELPPALLTPNAEWLVVARVHVARDGATELTITNATPDAAVNRAVEEALRRWRFRPTYIRGYLPQDSTIELSVKISAS